MEYITPRVLLAGTQSGCGKTTVSCAVIQALVNRRLKVAAFKCGPDYIDPMFHSQIIGTKCSNLDLFFFDRNSCSYLLAKNGAGSDLSVIEGVMGFYDGMGLTSTVASSYDISMLTQSPVVLVVDAKGAALSVLATIQGFLDFCPDNHICAVILNQCSAAAYTLLAQEIKTCFAGKIYPLGFMPSMPQCFLESRHLGLITASEVEGLRDKLQLLAVQAEKTIDLDALINLAQKTPAINCKPVTFSSQGETVRIAVARDAAFCFYYDDSLGVLRDMGAELVPFSPLKDALLPSHIHGIYLGGGYPELYAQVLSQNSSMRSSLKEALDKKLPCIAECGGFMYLTESIAGFPMVGFIAGKSFDTGKLTRFGYVSLRANRDTMLCKSGEMIRAHEFHYWDSQIAGDAFTAVKKSGKKWMCVHATDVLYAGFPHLHFYANPSAALNFYKACLKEKHRYD